MSITYRSPDLLPAGDIRYRCQELHDAGFGVPGFPGFSGVNIIVSFKPDETYGPGSAIVDFAVADLLPPEFRAVVRRDFLWGHRDTLD
jgi:hypothetical protein